MMKLVMRNTSYAIEHTWLVSQCFHDVMLSSASKLPPYPNSDQTSAIIPILTFPTDTSLIISTVNHAQHEDVGFTPHIWGKTVAAISGIGLPK
jgi:hypothetical protein